jgi:hypothetical protein
VSDERQLGVDLFNGTWRLIESRADDDLMIDSAHASAYHWANAPECAPENRARSHWLLARVYSLAGREEPALHHANRCLALCEQHGLVDWDLAFAYEALARASSDAAERRRYVELARNVSIAGADDREQLENDLATI